MRKLIPAIMLLAGIGLVSLAILWQPKGSIKNPPNVVLIVVDTLRADRVHAMRNGKAVMPMLAALAAEGADFRNAIAPSSWTRPSMASLFTGVHVDAHQVNYSVEEENPDQPTSDTLPEVWVSLPEWLASNGFDNFAFVTNANLAYPIGFGQGFQPQRYIFGNNARADEVTHRSLKELQGLTPPFFMYLHYMDPHVPYNPPNESRDTFGEVPEILPEDAPIFDDFMAYYMECVYLLLKMQDAPTMPHLSEAGKERVRMLYDLECHYVDYEVGNLIREMRSQHPDTIFIITSDHGEEFWERGGMGHGTTLYQEQAQVPLIVIGPGIGPKVIEEAVETLAIPPTLASLLNLPALNIWTGNDLFDQGSVFFNKAFARTLGPWKKLNVDVEAHWNGKMKTIRNNAQNIVEVFDLSQDPGELNNLAETNPEISNDGLAALDKHKSENVRLRRADKSGTQLKISPEELEHLRTLGYFGEEPTPKPAPPPSPPPLDKNEEVTPESE